MYIYIYFCLYILDGGLIFFVIAKLVSVLVTIIEGIIPWTSDTVEVY